MKRLSTLLIATAALACVCCQGPLPEPSQTGQNTFGCRVNGENYIPDGRGAFSGIKGVNGGFLQLYGPLRIGIAVWVYSQDKRRIALYLNDFRLGQHLLDQNPGTVPEALYAALNPKDYGSYDSSEGESYATSAKHMGWINIAKADTTTGIVSGTFEFEAATLDGKTVSITNGRFDVNARTQ